jgi:hypothetical protein
MVGQGVQQGFACRDGDAFFLILIDGDFYIAFIDQFGFGSDKDQHQHNNHADKNKSTDK